MIISPAFTFRSILSLFTLILLSQSVESRAIAHYFKHAGDFMNDIQPRPVVPDSKIHLLQHHEELLLAAKDVQREINDIIENTPHILKQQVHEQLEDTPFDPHHDHIHLAHEKEEELDTLYYWFTLHDIDGDGALDGNELLAAFSSWGLEEGNQHLVTGESDSTLTADEFSEAKKFKVLESMMVMVDNVLVQDDINRDGKIEIEEFLQSQFY